MSYMSTRLLWETKESYGIYPTKDIRSFWRTIVVDSIVSGGVWRIVGADLTTRSECERESRGFKDI